MRAAGSTLPARPRSRMMHAMLRSALAPSFSLLLATAPRPRPRSRAPFPRAMRRASCSRHPRSSCGSISRRPRDTPVAPELGALHRNVGLVLSLSGELGFDPVAQLDAVASTTAEILRALAAMG